MDRIVKRFLGTVCLLLLAACGGGSSASGSGGGTAPAISSFTATPPSIAPGASTTLTWSVSGATSLSIDEGVGAVTGKTSIAASPSTTTTYTLTATNAAGSSSASAKVTVVAPKPLIASESPPRRVSAIDS